MTGRWERSRNNSGVVERERKNVMGGFIWRPLWYRLGKTKDEECSGASFASGAVTKSTADGNSSCRPCARKESAESQGR